MRYLFEAIPVILAIYAAVTCAKHYVYDRRKHNKYVLILGVISSLLLIIAQSSWWVTAILNKDLEGTWFANQIWTVFNSLTMISFIVLANGGPTNVEKPTSSGD